MDKRPRVLLILKPSPARESLAEVLTQDGFEVEATGSTFRGVSGIARQPREIVVFGLDDVMDEELEAIKVIRADCPDSFILVTFSVVNRRIAQRAIQLGADAYVLEPLKVDEVRSVLARFRSHGTARTEPAEPPAEAPRSDSREPVATPPKQVRPPEKTVAEPEAIRKPEPVAPKAPERPSQEHIVSLRKLGASVAHEINNPLTTLSGWIQLLMRKVNGNQDLHRTLLSMKEEADRIADVVRDLNAVTEPELSDRGFTDLNTLVTRIIENFLATNGNSSIQLKTVLSEEKLRVKADVELVAGAVSDLLNSRYLNLGSSGSLILRTLSNGAFAELHVYEPGSQVELAGLYRALENLDLNEGDQIGEDLHLARAKQILDSHQATFQAEAELREGLSFVVKFPLVD